MKKKCSKCGKVRSEKVFKKDSRYSKGLFCWCKDCESIYASNPLVLKRGRKIKKLKEKEVEKSIGKILEK
jgi:hypothetical protein